MDLLVYDHALNKGAMKNPPHPGGVALRQCIEPLGLSITGAAAALGVTRNTLSVLVNGKRGVSPEMAVRLSKVFGGAEEGCLVQQAHYDIRGRLGSRQLQRLDSGGNPFHKLERLLRPAAQPPTTQERQGRPGDPHKPKQRPRAV